jgi:hypothetical protein
MSRTSIRTSELGGGGCLALLIGLPLYIALMAIVRGAVFVKLWEWFIQPVFVNAPTISLVEAIGISLVVSFLAYQGNESDDSDSLGEAIFKIIFDPIFYYGLVYVVATIVHSFMP